MLRRSRCVLSFLLTYNLYRECNCCTMHIAKATDVFSSHDCIFYVERVPIDRHFLFSARGVNMLPPWPSPLRHSHPCLSPTYTRSVFEGGSGFLRPSVRSTPTTHSEGLLQRVGALPCAPTYNRGVVQHAVFNRLGLAQAYECSSKAATCHANSTAVQPASNLQQHLIICCTEDVTAARCTLQRLHTDIFSGHDCVFFAE